MHFSFSQGPQHLSARLHFHASSLWSKRSGIVEIKSQKHGCSIGSSTPNPPIKAPEARSPFPDFFYRGLVVSVHFTLLASPVVGNPSSFSFPWVPCGLSLPPFPLFTFFLFFKSVVCLSTAYKYLSQAMYLSQETSTRKQGLKEIYSETFDISHLQDFKPSSNSSVRRVTTFDVWEIPPKILYLL